MPHLTKTTRLILVALPTLIAGVFLVVILNWHVRTRVRIALTTERVVFNVGEPDAVPIVDSVGLRAIVIEKFQSIKLKPERLSLFVRDPEIASNRPSARLSGNLSLAQLPLVITSKEGRGQSNVTLAGTGASPRALLTMDTIAAKPLSEVVLENTEDADNFIIRVDGQQSSGNITVAEPIKLTTDQCEIAGIRNDLSYDQPLSFEAKLLKDSAIEFNSQQSSLILTITVPNEKSTALFPKGHIPVTAIRFERLDGQTGKVLSSLAKGTSCEITYPDYEGKVEKTTIRSPDFLWIDDLRNFSIEEMTYDAEKKGVSMTLHGEVNKITSGSSDYPKDHRLTIYNSLWNNYKVVALFAGLCWIAGTTVAFLKFYREQ